LVATVQSHICQFHKPLVEMLHENNVEVHVCARDNLKEKNGLKLDFADNVFNVPFQRSPFSPKNLKAYKMLKKVINEGEYDVVHCNTPVGGILTRLICKKIKKDKPCVIYEAHGFHFFKGGSKKNWLLYYPIEKHFAKYTDTLITINKMDYQLAKEKFSAKKVEYIPGVGVNLSGFIHNENAITKEDIGLTKEDKIVLSVGELNKNKNHQVIIKAISKIEDKNVHYVLCGNGPLENELKELANKLGVQDRVHFMGYRRDVVDFYPLADVFAFPSRREGLGLAPIEAMNFGVPLVTSNRHGINDYSENGVTGFKYSPDDYLGFAEGIMKLLNDKELSDKIKENNKIKAQEFSVENSIKEMKRIYQSIDEKSCSSK
ncbi:MAG: glycosyltransferase family 4 protein, partial [Firmicutes bacterium]|nr:glycosyltransferase family 4 protein [Candidatus Caballimonas caccae]